MALIRRIERARARAPWPPAACGPRDGGAFPRRNAPRLEGPWRSIYAGGRRLRLLLSTAVGVSVVLYVVGYIFVFRSRVAAGP